MIYFYIPDFFYHYNVNIKLLDLIKEKPQMFYDDFQIAGIYGNFPNCMWNGGTYIFGPHISHLEQKAIAQTFNEKYEIPLILTMTNPLISGLDCLDRYSNYILENLDNGINQILVTSPDLEYYIRNKYPNYLINRSILAAEKIYYDDSDKYYKTVLNKKKNKDFDFLSQIQNKDKIEILINENCVDDCPRAYSHYIDYAKQQKLLTNGPEVMQSGCNQNKGMHFESLKKSSYYITRDEIKQVYEPMGFKHFKLCGRGTFPQIIIHYANYMVKPEYKDDFLGIMIPEVLSDLLK